MNEIKKNKNGKLINPYGEVYGYARVSTVQQHEDRQLIALEEYGVDTARIFLDKQSGKNFNRPSYKRMIRVIRKGDIVVIKSIDRLGRNYTEIIDQFNLITKEIGCGIHVLDMPIINTSGDPLDLVSKFMSDIILQLLSFVAQNERENTMHRQREGIEAAKRKRRVRIGRPKTKMAFDFWEIYIMWKTKEFPTSDLYRFCHEVWGTSNRTFFRKIHELDKRFGDLPPERLRDLVFDEEMFDGIEFSYERLEVGIDHFNPFVHNDPYKNERQRLNRLARKAQMTEEEIKAEEIQHMKDVQAARMAEFKKKFNISVGEGVEYTMEEMPTKLIYKDFVPKSMQGPQKKKRGRPKRTCEHSDNSGHDIGITLIEDEEIEIKDTHEDPMVPMKTVIIL